VNVHPTKQEVRISNEAQITSLLAEAVRGSLAQAPDLAPSLLPGYQGPADHTYRLQPHSSATTWGTLFDRPQTPSIDPPILFRDSLRITRILGQIHRTFLVAETEEGWMMIDQHAAHERVMFEQLLKNLQSAQAERQALLLEEVLELSPKDRERFEESIPMLKRIGFEIEPFGEGAYCIRAVPAVFTQENPVALLQTFLEEQEEKGRVRTRLDDESESVAALLACKRESVKAGSPMAPEAIRALLARLAQCENPFTCPHGRPVFFAQTVADLARQFKRT
jgi:DNA mismatch repair protein MutL